MKVHFFFNPAAASGRAGERLGAALANFRTAGVEVQLYRPASAHDSRSEMAALAGTSDRVVVMGGDGMVHQAANALVDSGTVLGIISAGTGNDAVTSLGLSDSLDQACAAALRDPKPIDLIDGPAGVAVTVATGGFSVAVNERADEMERVKGGAKYTLSSLIELPKLRPTTLTMTLDGNERQIEASLIAVANTKYFGGGMKIAPDASHDDGLLDVIVLGAAPRVVFASLLPTVFSGRHVKSKHVSAFRAAKVELAGADLTMRADGEPFGTLPTTLTTRPQSLLIAGAS